MNALKRNGSGDISHTAVTVPAAAKKFANTGDDLVVFRGTDGVELRGVILRLQPFRVVFEAYPVRQALKVSQVFAQFQVWVGGRLIYSGRAVVCNFLNLGSAIACEVELFQPETAVPSTSDAGHPLDVVGSYQEFFNRWQQQSKVSLEFKAVVSDLHGYLSGLKLMLEQAEMFINAQPHSERTRLGVQVTTELATPVLTSMNTLRERLLETASHIAPQCRPAHEWIIRHQLHPLFLCAPFAFRAYQKPLGYAGDYEMMNMIHRNTFEGDSLYARLVHYWLVNQYPAISVRNRIAHMKAKLVQEAVRRSREKRPVRILNLGCGPAREVGQFIAENHFADQAEFTLIDFDAETISHASAALNEIKSKHGRKTAVEFVQMSVAKLLKESLGRSNRLFPKPFDLVYCGGLFDYFSDETCRQLVEMFYRLLAPGGLAVVANMDDRVPYKQMQEYLLDWHLIYRDGRQMAALAPDGVAPADCKLVSEQMGVNLFLEVRKPDRN